MAADHRDQSSSHFSKAKKMFSLLVPHSGANVERKKTKLGMLLEDVIHVWNQVILLLKKEHMSFEVALIKCEFLETKIYQTTTICQYVCVTV